MKMLTHERNADQKESPCEALVSFGHAQPIQKSMILDHLEELLQVTHQLIEFP